MAVSVDCAGGASRRRVSGDARRRFVAPAFRPV